MTEQDDHLRYEDDLAAYLLTRFPPMRRVVPAPSRRLSALPGAGGMAAHLRRDAAGRGRAGRTPARAARAADGDGPRRGRGRAHGSCPARPQAFVARPVRDPAPGARDGGGPGPGGRRRRIRARLRRRWERDRHRYRTGAPGATAVVERTGDQGILRVSGLPQRRNGIYEVWIARDGQVQPSTLFQVHRDGTGAAAIPEGLEGADQVMVTLEPPGGSAKPTRAPR